MNHIHITKSNTNNPQSEVKYFNSTLRIIKGLCMATFLVLSACYYSIFLSGGVIAVDHASAASLSFSVDNTATILELTIPSSVNLNLTPTSGITFNTANLNIGIGTNNSTGYNLSMLTTSTDLTRTSTITDGNNQTSTPVIPTITSAFSPAEYETSNSTINTWGYKKSTETNFKAMVASSTIPLSSTNAPSNSIGSDVVLNFISKVDTTLPSGTYNTTLNFTAVSNVPTVSSINDLTYMQDFAVLSDNEKWYVINSMNDNTNYTLTDKRDNNTYTIKKINGQVWMTQNLRIMGTIRAEDSNFTGDNFNASEYSLDNNDANYTNHCDSTNGYNYACAKYSGNTTTGAWYNYYAATAGTIAGSSNTAKATQDICPKGWRLPSGPSNASGTDFNKLVGNTVTGWQEPTVGLMAFGGTSGGYYSSGHLVNQGYGSWWSATATDIATERYSLDYNNDQFKGSAGGRNICIYVRCLAS